MRGIGLLCAAIACATMGMVAAVSAAPQAAAQGTASAAEGKRAAEFARLYRAWKKGPDRRREVAQLADLVKLEAALKRWPLGMPRARVKCELLLALGNAYRDAKQGNQEENLEKAIAAYQGALLVSNRKAFPKDWAEVQLNLGAAYVDRIDGESIANIEVAIGHLEAANTVLTRKTHPREWAMVQLHLGGAYALRLSGDRADNPESAIGHLDKALTVFARESYSQEWAMAQVRLGWAHVYRVLGDKGDNQRKAIGHFSDALTVFTPHGDRREWGWTQVGFGRAYIEYIGGDKADNIEKAIAAYDAALQVRTREVLPRRWAFTHLYLGASYFVRIRGNPTDNLETAISHFEPALKVLTREAHPDEWATAQLSLGLAYIARPRGDRADNLEAGISHTESALEVLTRETNENKWAEVQLNLGLYYGLRTRGNKAENAETAIRHLEAALKMFTRELHRREWAVAQLNLGFAHLSRLRGEPADNVEKAIAHLQQALDVFNLKAYPDEWSRVQLNLGLAHFNRIRGEPGKNVETAIEHYKAALTAFSRENQADEWAMTQLNLGMAYGARIIGERVDNERKQIAHLEEALKAFTPEANSYWWAMTRLNLGVAHFDRVHGRSEDDVEKVIAHAEAALKVFTPEAYPREWAIAQGNLGAAHAIRSGGDKADNRQKAIRHLEAALTVFTREASPRDHLRVASALGSVFLQAGEWHKAGVTYASARAAFRLLFGLGLHDSGARSLIELAGPLFAEAAYAAVERGELETALELSNEGRAVQLRAALRQQIELPRDKRSRHEGIKTELRGLSGFLRAATGAGALQALKRQAELLQELGELLAAAGGKDATSGGVMATAGTLLRDVGAIVVPIVTEAGSKMLLVTASKDGTHITAIDLSQLDTERLNKIMRGDGTKVAASGGWLGAYQIQYIEEEKELNKRFPEWLGAIDKVGPELWALFGEALDRALQERGVKSGARIALLPAGSLGLLPLGLARNPGPGPHFGDTYEIVYVPSLDALAAASRHLAEPPPPSLAVTINPMGDLPLAEIEGELVAAHFGKKSSTSNIIGKSSARPKIVVEALEDRSYWHFASHGKFDWNDVRASGLKMRDEEILTIGGLLDTEGRLGRPRLVVLSACETGLYDIDRNPEEFVGLPGAFLQIGAAGVVSSLWPVDDLATALLIAKFYDLHMRDRLAPPTALKGAQAWLREATRGELIAYAKAAAAGAKLDPSRLAEIETDLANSRRALRLRIAAPSSADSVAAPTPPEPQAASEADRVQSRPFQHPYYWGGFIYTGL